MLSIPLQAVPSQKIKTVLANQIVQLDVYQLRYGMFMNVWIGTTMEVGGVICENRNRIIRNAYLNEAIGFEGDFIFDDQEGRADPVYTGLGSRYRLLYLSQADLDVLGLPG
jgi:hypothetical protein